jgi:DNA-binding MarR family transcriptional regulator
MSMPDTVKPRDSPFLVAARIRHSGRPVVGTLPAGTPERRNLLPQPTREDFERLLAFRVSLRRFQRWSEDQARTEGLTHVQHQLLVAIKGHPGDIAPAIGEIADYLQLRPHSAAELVNRAEAAGLVRRFPDAADARVVRVDLTRKGDRLVTELTQAHLAELHNLAAALDDLVTSRGPG